MSTDSVDLRQLNPETLNLAIAEWVKLDRLVDPSHEKFRNYQDLSTKAKSAYERIKLNLSIPGGLANIDAEITKLNEMYEEALAIRGEMAADGMKNGLGMDASTSFESEIDKRLNTAFLGMNDQYRSTIETKLLPMLYGLGVNPADVRAGDTEGNFYFEPNTGRVNFEKVRAGKDMVAELRAAGNVAPGLLGVADLLEAGLQRMEAIDPPGAAVFAQYEKEQAGRAWDTKPLRMVGALGAGLITVFGLAQFAVQSVRGKNPEFSPLILGWAAATMAIVNPKIFLQSGTSKVLEKITDLGQPENRKVIGNGFSDPEALAELQELRSENANGITDLSKLDALNVAQVEALTGSKDSPLTKALIAMPESLRPSALRQFGIKAMDEGEIEITQTFMKTPGLAR